MSALLDSSPQYQAVTIMRVDWGSAESEEISKELGVSNRSTLVMFNEGKEVGRVQWTSSKEAIEPLFKAVL